MPKRKYVSQPSGTSNKKWRKFKKVVRKYSKPQFSKAQSRNLKELLKEAKKWQDVERADIALTPTMAYIGPSSPTNGAFFTLPVGDDDEGQRNGETVSATTIDLRGTLKAKYNGTTVVRIMLVQWEQRGGANINQVLETPVPPAGLTYSSNTVDSFRKINGTQKYTVLWDRKITMNKDGEALPTGGTFGVTQKAFRAYVKLKPSQAKMTYDSDAATSPNKNPIYLYACYADVTGVQAFAPVLQYTARLRYVDV